jgi:hypothetical protein
MNTVKFQLAKEIKTGGIDFNDPNLKKPGVYIVGVKIAIDNQGEKFCPLIVGEAKSLKNRIMGHRDPNNTDAMRGELNSFKELFNFNVLINNPAFFYDDIRIWDEEWISKYHTKRTDLETLCKNVKANHNSLVWFPNPVFYDVYLEAVSNIDINVNLNRHNATFQKRKNLLDVPTIKAKELIDLITKVKSQIFDNYFFAYACSADNTNQDIDFSNKLIRETIEDNTKTKLKSIGIHTYAKDKNSDVMFFIDLLAIQEDLVKIP